MIDTWRAQAALTRLDKAIGFPRDEEVSVYLSEVEGEIEDMECEEEHCDYEHGDLIDPGGAERYIRAKLNRIKLGVYSEERDGDLLAVLEEIERISAMTGTEKHPEVEVAPDVTFNGLWYTVTTPGGMTWSFEDEDRDAAYVKESLWAWSRWLDFIEGRNDRSTES